jgi:uncharacterized protein (DUF2235 family)
MRILIPVPVFNPPKIVADQRENIYFRMSQLIHAIGDFMSKNVLIFSDGTGARGGLFVDERRSNVYKLYRATRCDPESEVDPRKQVAFYNPGIGTSPPGSGTVTGIGRRIYNLVSAALGLGLTRNIIDCYAAIVRLYRPGDRIFLFGFSRGAYTVRCVAAVVAFCGVPTRMKDGSPLRLDPASIRSIAIEAVTKVYQHTSSWKSDDGNPRHAELLEQRRELARRFRKIYGSGDENSANVYPHFIGVFDTVASLSNPVALLALLSLGLAAVIVAGTALWLAFGRSGAAPGWNGLWQWLASIVGIALFAIVLGFLTNLANRIRWEFGLPRRNKLVPFHLAEKRMNFYDTQLNANVGYARHALSIDEGRPSFTRVPWGSPANPNKPAAATEGLQGINWFEQLWFAGNHSDIGGSYPESEARLSDISLSWMLEAARNAGMYYDERLLRLHPDPAGPMHDEVSASRIFSYFGRQPRKIPDDAPLHPSVLQRMEETAVLNYDLYEPYRPMNLQQHWPAPQPPSPAA